MKTQNHLSGWFNFLRRGVQAVVTAAVLSAVAARAGTAQTITFQAIPNQVNTNAPFPLVATASSGLPVTFTVVSAGNVASISGTNATLTGLAGSVTIAAQQAGNGTFAPAPVVTQTFVVRNT